MLSHVAQLYKPKKKSTENGHVFFRGFAQPWTQSPSPDLGSWKNHGFNRAPKPSPFHLQKTGWIAAPLHFPTEFIDFQCTKTRIITYLSLVSASTLVVLSWGSAAAPNRFSASKGRALVDFGATCAMRKHVTLFGAFVSMFGSEFSMIQCMTHISWVLW